MKLSSSSLRLGLALLLTFSVVASTGCRSKGSHEFKPGRGWVPN